MGYRSDSPGYYSAGIDQRPNAPPNFHGQTARDAHSGWADVDVAGTAPRPPATSPAPCGLDFRDVDLLHGHHGGKSPLRLRAAGGHGFHQRARSDLPRQAPAILAP